jgi:hypothetical protein
MSEYEHAMVEGRSYYRSRGFTPRVTVGAGLDLAPFHLGTDLSFGNNPAFNVSTSLKLF